MVELCHSNRVGREQKDTGEPLAVQQAAARLARMSASGGTGKSPGVEAGAEDACGCDG